MWCGQHTTSSALLQLVLHVLWSAGNFILILERHQRLFQVIPRDVSHMLRFCHFYVLLCTWGWVAVADCCHLSSSPPSLSLFTIPFLNCFSLPPSLQHVTLHLLPMNVASKSVASFRRCLITRLVSQQFLSFCFSTYKFVIHQIEQNFKRLMLKFASVLAVSSCWLGNSPNEKYSLSVLQFWSCECALVFSRL